MRKATFLLFSIISYLSASAQIVNVATSNELQTALNTAQPGHIITLKPNTTFSVASCTNCVTNNGSGFKVPKGINGTTENPIKIVGDKTSIITSGNLTSKYGLHLQGNNYWVIEGFTVTNSSKCVMLDSSMHNVINDLRITKSGQEALHLRKYSSYNIVSNCFVDSTGMNPTDATNGIAEGIYVGSSNSNWSTYTNNQIDTCNYNVITGNTFGSSVISENIDIKEGTKGGEISNNTFNGMGCNGANSADSYLDVKGDFYTIKCNSGSGNNSFILDGFQTHIIKVTTINGNAINTTFGDNNTFINNSIDMSGATGYAIWIHKSSSYPTITHNSVCTNNNVLNSSKLTNTTNITNCDNPCSLVTTIGTLGNELFSFSPNPFLSELKIMSNSKATISLLDINGTETYQNSIVRGENIVSISTLKAGIYFLKVVSENNEVSCHKVVKQ